MRNLARRMLPPPLRSVLWNVLDDSADFVDRLRGRHDAMQPPRKMIRNIGGSYDEVGKTFVERFVELGGLQPGDHVLDVGCGAGRMAVPLARYLDSSGSYAGFDIDATEIGWCVRNITSRYPNFHFQVADIHSKRYNPTGRYAASEYRFPYADSSFDFVFLTSVFTHLLPPALENYFHEITRVMKPDATSLMTFLLLNEESRSLIAQHLSHINLPVDRGSYRLSNDKVPEEAVAYDQRSVISLCNRCGLRVHDPIRLGQWCGRANGYDYQDIMLASKA